MEIWLASWSTRQKDVLSNPWDIRFELCMHARRGLRGDPEGSGKACGTKPRARPRCWSAFGRPESGDWSTKKNVALESRETRREARLGYPRIPTNDRLDYPPQSLLKSGSASLSVLLTHYSAVCGDIPAATAWSRRLEMPVKCLTTLESRRREIQMGVLHCLKMGLLFVLRLGERSLRFAMLAP